MLMSAQERSGVRIRTTSAFAMPTTVGAGLNSKRKRAQRRWAHAALRWPPADVSDIEARPRKSAARRRALQPDGTSQSRAFLDRLKCVIRGQRPKTASSLRSFSSTSTSSRASTLRLGLVRGDSLLLTVARRLQRHLGPQDTAARVGGDQFAMLFIGEREARNLPALAERVRRSLRAPIPLANQEVVLTGSMGVAVWDGRRRADGDLLKDAELAMYRAKQSGTDRIEVFDPSMRRDRDLKVDAELGGRSKRASSRSSISRSSIFRPKSSRALKLRRAGTIRSSVS